MPAAYFITFATYGSHLHGDDRGSFRAPAVLQPPSPAIVAHRQSLMTSAPMRLDAPMRDAVLRAIIETCRVRNWLLETEHVRTEHVHGVLRALERPEPVMNSLKAWSTRYLRDSKLVGSDVRVWARHGSTRWLWTEDDVAGAVDSVYGCQGEPMARYP